MNPIVDRDPGDETDADTDGHRLLTVCRCEKHHAPCAKCLNDRRTDG